MIANETIRKYDCLVVDVVNFCYRTFEKKKDLPVQVGPKLVYKESICKFITSIEDLSKKYLHSDGQVYLLFDNYYSRADLKSSFMFADRRKLDESYKETRKKENREFYNSINFLKYYYLIGPAKYHTAQITGLEADDLVKPLLSLECCKDKSCLLITTDLDWCRYLSNNPVVNWLPDLSQEPETIEDLSLQLGFSVSERNIILYKAIFGDASDNIDSMIPENEERKHQFISLLKEISYPEELILFSRDEDKREKWPILNVIATNERRYLTNLQLVSSIPCESSHLEAVLTTGRNADVLFKTVSEAIGLTDETKQFTFGNVRRPRA